MHRLILIGALVLAVSLPAVHAADNVVISEILANNVSGLRDEDGDRPDWIEIHNGGDAAVNLMGWSLTDKATDPKRWQFPAVELAADGYLIVFASDKNRAAAGRPLHANFKLKKKGDYLALIRPDGSIADKFSPAYPAQKNDRSYGFVSAGKRDYFVTPTPGAPNASVRQGKVDAVKLSHKRGWQNQPVKLELTTATEGAEIRYTLDGTEPTATHGEIYRTAIEIGRTTVIRAAAFKEGFSPSSVKTDTFLFANDIIRQSADGLPPAGWPFTWGDNRVDFGMDPKVVDDPRFKDEIVAGLKSLPTVSLVMNLDDLFGADKGIYANAGRDGRATEKPVSVEYIRTDGEDGFHIDAGIRIRGGFSRMPMNPKHAFRLFFRKEYGDAKLKYALFGEEGAKEFDNLDLRTTQNYSWSFQADPRAIFLRDEFNRDLQLAMDHPGARGDFVHLYINGIYWGLYNTCERPEASFGASYLGGDKDDYDVIKVNSGFGEGGMNSFGTTTTDGTIDAWKQLNEIARAGLADNARYQRLLGKNPDGTRNTDYPILLDPDDLIDYMLVIFYGGNMDAPVTKFGGNMRPNNWYGLRNRKGDRGFQFIIWDAEHTFLDVNEDRTGPFPAGQDLDTSNPQWLWQQCLDNAEFRVLVADHIQKRFYNDGLLTAENVTRRFRARAAEIESAAIAESARWGDTQAGFPMGTPPRIGSNGEMLKGPLNRDDDWRTERDRILSDFIPKRSDIVLAQLYAQGLVPDLAAPKIVQNAEGLIVSTDRGDVYYTLDGTDPRRIGGDPSTSASKEIAVIKIKPGLHLMARTRFEKDWSALVEWPTR